MTGSLWDALGHGPAVSGAAAVTAVLLPVTHPNRKAAVYAEKTKGC